MSRKSKKRITNRAKLVITVALIAICLLVMHKFEFLTKSEEVITTNVKFIEYGTENSMNADLELLTDENNNSYIELPENVNGYIAKKYYIYSDEIVDLEELKKQKDESNTSNENVVVNNDSTPTNIIDDNDVNQTPNNELNNTNTIVNETQEKEEKEEITNTIENTNVEDKAEISNEVDTIEDNTNTIVENIIVEENTNSTTENKIVENRVENKTTTNTVVENNNTISNATVEEIKNEVTNTTINEGVENKVVENTTSNFENTIDENKVVEEKVLKEYLPGDKVYLTEEQLEKEDLNVLAEYQTIEINGVKLYNQELVSESAEAKIVVTGYIPVGYGLNVKAEDINEIEELKADVEELKDTTVLAAYDIKILNGELEYQPKDYYQTVNVAITSVEKFKDNLIGKSIEVLHINESEDEILFEKINVSNKTIDTVECVTNEFSRYAVIKEDEITPNRVLVNNYDNDYNYYMGLNYTENFDGRETPYTENDMAEVTVNYYSYNKNKTEMNQIETSTVSWTRSDAGSTGGNRIVNLDIAATFGNDQYVDTTKPWTMQFKAPVPDRFNATATANDTTNNDITITYNATTQIVTVTGNNWNSWTQNTYKKYTLDIDLAYTGTGTVATFSGINTYGFMVTGTERLLIGYISTVQPTATSNGERQTLMTYTHAVPISGGKVSVELIDNPYMDRPGGAGFNGWLSADTDATHTITTNAKTYVQTVSTNVGADRKVTINLYADWQDANVIFVNTTAGAQTNDGSMTSPVNNWVGINSRLAATYNEETDTASDRELNIIVLMNGTLSNLYADANSAYTITSIYGGNDYREDATFQVSATTALDQDVQLAFLTVDGPANYNNNSGMDRNTDHESATGDLGTWVKANAFNFRIGRGMMPDDTAETEATFTQIQGGASGSSNAEYRLVIETGKYLNVQVARAASFTGHKIAATAIIGNDFDRVRNNNDDLKIYTKFSSRTGAATLNTLYAGVPIFDMRVKSGRIGLDCFKDTDDNKPYSGIYVGGHGSNQAHDNGDRILTVEGGLICNVIGGLASYSGDDARSFIYIKGGTIVNIVGGAGRSPTYGNRVIQVTDGTVLYSVNGGSNGVASTTSDNGTLNGSTKLYIGGNAVIGAEDTLTNNADRNDQGVATLYGTEAGCVLGAGNGNDNPQLMGIAGRVLSSHIIIDGNATINNSVYGGGNYGVVNSSANNDDDNDNGEPVCTFEDHTNNIVSGEVYIIANGTTPNSSRIFNVNNGALTGSYLSNTQMPTNNNLWRVTKNGNEYSFYNIGQQRYLNNDRNNLTLSGTSRTFTASVVNNGIRFYFVRNGSNRYFRINGSTITGTTTSTSSATSFRFLKAVEIEKPDDEEQEEVTAVTIEMHGGKVNKNIYGGSNQSDIVGSSTVKTYAGTINGAIYGGSNQDGDITQDTYIYIKGGTIGATGDLSEDVIFGGGLGNSTSVNGDATINITDSNGTIVLNGNIYGGSEAGTVSGDSKITVSDSVSPANTILITGNIYGGGKGAENDPATTNGDTTVIVDGGTYPGISVFGGCNVNGDIGGKILVEIGKTYQTTVDNVFGSGNRAAVTTNSNGVQVDIFSNANVVNAFNGGNQAGIAGTNAQVPRKITVDGGTVGNLYGGSNESGQLQATFVYVKNNAIIGNAFGGGLGTEAQINGNTLLDVIGSTITGSAYGGGSQGQVTGNTIVNVTNSNINDSLYGGGKEASVATTDINIENSIVTNNIYGGGENGAVIGNVNNKSTDVYMLAGSQAQNVFGGGKGEPATVSNITFVTIDGSNVIGDKENMDAETPATNGNVFGGGDRGLVSGGSVISILNSSTITNNIFGGGNQADLGGNTSIAVENSSAFSIYGGGNAGNVDGTTAISALGTIIDKNIYGGGNQGEVTENTTVTISDTVDNTNQTITSDIGGSVYGGGRAANVNGTTVIIQNKTQAQNVYGGGEYGEVEYGTVVEIEDSTIENSVYGGGKGADGSTDATLPGQVKGSCSVEISNNSVIQNRVFGAGEGITAEVGANTQVDFYGNSSTGDDIYGGGDNGPVKGATSLYISSGNIGGNAYAAGNGVTALVDISSYLGVDGNTTIAKSAFGGGNAAETGNKYIDGATGKETGDALVIVDIAGAVIGENVYGGANSSVIYGSTVINIGLEAINDYYASTNQAARSFVRGKVDIGGTIFGGGEQMDPTKEFNYDTISVTKTILINIDGEGYETSATDTNTFNFYESVFGSGNASSANTNGDINIRNYGTREVPKRGISIQRATNVVMDNASILLNGTTDSTSAHPEGLFALNRITHLKSKNNTTLYLVNGANLLAHYSSMVGEDGNEEYATAQIIDTVVGENGTSYQVINGKIYDGRGNLEYYVSNGAIFEPNTTGIGEDIEITKIATIQNATTINKNTDNRIYMYSGRNLNISDDEEVTSKYGDVKGMTFFGIFRSSDGGEGQPGNDANSVYMGMYDPSYTTGGTLSWNERDFNRSYVLGLHERNPEQDITKDGFYTVYEKMGVELDEDDILNAENYASFSPTSYTSYITPTPKDDVYYMWYAGPDDEVFYYSFILTASKHSTFGTKELSLLGISYENAVLTLTGVDASLVNGVGLYNKNDIPNINTDQRAANNNFGLTMKTSTSGWSMSGNTDVYADAITDINHTNNTSYDGTNKYIIENLKTTPAFVFFLYHSNNITEAKELGTVQFNMGLSYWRDALNRGSARIIIDAILLSEVYDDTGYNGAIAPGTHYDLFANTVTNITTESSFSTYFEFAQENFSQIENIRNYYDDSYRVITTEYPFPIGTTITMIDRWDKNNPAYYYLDITNDEYGRVEFRLDEFKVMGSSNEKFNEKSIRDNYHITENNLDYEYENFIFIANFENAEFPELPEGQKAIVKDQHFRMYLKTMIDGREEILFGLLDDQIDSIVYGIYDDESTIDVNASLSKSRVFLGNDVLLKVNTVYDVKKGEQSVTIYDTRYFDKKLGVKLTFYKKNDVTDEYEVVNGANLLGTYFELNNEKYYPRADGTTRIKIAELVSNASSSIKIGTENSALATGEYQIKIESFGSADGIYYGVEASATTWVSLELINDVYGLNSTLPVEQVIIDKATGYTLDATTGKMNEVGNNMLNFDIEYLSGLNNPYITVALYRREYDESMNNPYQNDYEKVDLTEYVTNELEIPVEVNQVYDEKYQEFLDSIKQFEKEYTAIDTQTIKAAVIDNTISVTLNADYVLKQDLKSGTYKVVFTLYDASDEIVYKEETNDKGESTQIPFDITEYMYIGDTFSYIIIK